MSPYYYRSDLYPGRMAAFLGVYLVIFLVFAVGGVILQGIAPYKMAKNAGIPRPWLAFIPVAQGYIFGLLAERSLYTHTGKRTPLAKINLWLPIATAGLTCLSGILAAMGGNVLAVLVGLLLTVGGLAAAFYLYYTYYYIYKDYAPDNAVLFLVLSLLIPAALLIIMIIHMNVVPVSVAGRSPYGQPKYGAPGPQGPQGGYGQNGYNQGPGGYGQNGGGQGGPGGDDHRGPEL